MAERETPPEGGTWPNNGEVYERARMEAEQRAEKAQAAGEIAEAVTNHCLAAGQRRERDRCYREHWRRVVNRRVRYGTW